MRDFLRRHKKSISPNRCFHLFKSNLFINTFLHERIPNRCWINNSRCPFFDSGDYSFWLVSFRWLHTCIRVPVHVAPCVCACAHVSKCERPHGMFVKAFMAHMCICSEHQPHYIPKTVHETN